MYSRTSVGLDMVEQLPELGGRQSAVRLPAGEGDEP